MTDLPSDRFAEHDASDDIASLMGGQTPIGSLNQEDYTCNQDNDAIYTVDGVTLQLKCNWASGVKTLAFQRDTTLKECADICANNTDCVGADWRRSTRVCYLKGPENFPGLANTAYHEWRVLERLTRSCPSPRLEEPKKDAQLVENPKCPEDNGNMFTSEDDAHYTLICCGNNSDKSEISKSRSVVKSFEDCAAKCSGTSGCQSFVYTSQPSGNEPNGTCKLYETGGFRNETDFDSTHDYAYMTAPPEQESEHSLSVLCSTTCPFADGLPFSSIGGEVFHMTCGARQATKVIYEDVQPTFKDCMNACSTLLSCHSVDYHINSKICYYSNAHARPATDSSGFQTAYSMGCAGACNGGSCNQSSKVQDYNAFGYQSTF
ncbi:hypothetical protein N7494_002408 [Penicillium frequentans]|uniref:Apple domain-containing protein n=1 Tax=Penicillium frequentans TaxID=3151616 RepID=A0AAD6GKF1_9EURO|nr:hypothetical protein N7494_002408 [Penicillium glabrum]